jgi:hypothetical protein
MRTEMSEEQQARDFTECANRISQAMHECFDAGHGVAFVCIVAAHVATDYMRTAFKDNECALNDFGDVIHERLNEPMPEIQMVN